MKKKKVLIATGIFPPDIGGPATYAKILVDELPRYGIQAQVVNFSPLMRYPTVLRHCIYLARMLQLCPNADVILALDPVSVGLPSALAAIVWRKRLVLKIGGDYAWEQAVQRFGVDAPLDQFRENRYGWQVDVLRWVESFVASRSDEIIVPSLYLKNTVSEWDVDTGKIQVIYNAYVPPNLAISKHEARKRLDLEGSIVVTVGRLVPWKGIKLLIDVVNELTSSIPDLFLVVVGSGPQLRELAQRAERIGLRDRVTFTGTVPHETVIQFLRAADLFVLNSAYEGLSHSILEAMAVGTPVAVTRSGGNPELIEHRVSGLLIDYNEKEQLSDAIMEILTNGDVASSLATNASDALSDFGLEQMIRDTVAVLTTDK